MKLAEAGWVEVDDVLVVAFRYLDSGSTIEFARDLGEPDRQDTELGMGTYSICVDAGAVHYGGLEGWALRGTTFSFALTESAAAALQMDREHTLTLGPAFDFEALATALARVLRGPDHRASDPHEVVGISSSLGTDAFPINGLRHPEEGRATGWYLWAGEEFPTRADGFGPLHAVHLVNRCPEVLPYLTLAPGWRFLLAPDYVDVWFDPSLLDV